MTLIFSLFLASTIVQIFYWWYLFSRLAFEEASANNSKQLKGNGEGVSVIVCAHNEIENLKALVPQLISQDHPRFEVIIVNDRSTDGSEHWLQAQRANLSNLKVISQLEIPPGINAKKQALTTGIEAAKYDILLLTDADCLPASGEWISTMTNRYQPDIDIVLGYSGYRYSRGFLNRFIRYETILTAIMYLSRALSGHPYMGVGRNISYRKSYFQQVNGLNRFMEITGGDDDLFVNQSAHGANTGVCIKKSGFTVSHAKTSWLAYFKQKKRHMSVGKYYQSRHLWLLGIFSASHTIFWSSLVSLLIASTLVNWIVAGFVLRQLAHSWVIKKSSEKLGEGINLLYLPLLDFLFSLFYLYTGIAALFSKKIDWD